MLKKKIPQPLIEYANSRLVRACALFLLIVFLGNVLWLSGAAANFYQMSLAETWKKSTSHMPEALTELYFSDPTAVPTTYTPGKAIPVSFSLHNLERGTAVYRYRIYVEGQGRAEINQLVLHDGETKRVDTEVMIPGSPARTKVTVELIGESQRIYFWVDKADE